MSEQTLELVDSEAEASAVTNPEVLLPTLTILWDPTAGVMNLKFDGKTFKTWPLVLAVLEMAKTFATQQWEATRAMAAQEMAAAEAMQRQLAGKRIRA